jgi:hypothetical protein
VTVGAIRSLENYAKAAARRRTERFNHCFPRGITMGDIDSHVEINHHWLFVEYKKDDQPIERGQWMDLSRLAARPRMSVWIIWTTEDGFITHGQRISTSATREWSPRHKAVVTEDLIAQKIKEWVTESEKAPRPTALEAALDRLLVIARIDAIRSQLMLDVITEIGGAL